MNDPIPSFDTNELAFGDTRTLIRWKNKTRITGIRLANDTFVSEPKPAFAAQYPYNNVTSSLSGHIKEVDDTPGHERIAEFHRSGTFYEIDNEGNRVTKIFGNDWHIVLGDETIVVGGKRNIVIQGGTNVTISGDAVVKVVGNADMKVSGSMAVDVGGKFDLVANEVFIQSKTVSNLTSETQTTVTSNGQNRFNAPNNYFTDRTFENIQPPSRARNFGIDDVQVMFPTPSYQLTFKNIGDTNSRVFKERYT